MGLTADDIEGVVFYYGQGCEECRHTGFKGRTALFEYLAIDSELRNEISKKSDSDKIRNVALSKGLVTLRRNGWEKVRQGVTTMAEVLRVTLEK
jgi:general secretion pathway protein E